MDYEKKYKDALERMKYWMDENTPDEFFDKHEVHTFVFPELAESEDENIKEEIIHYLEITCNQMTPNQDWNYKNRWLPWLEKQGNKVIDFPQNHKDMNNPNGCIVLEDFNDGEGFYKLNLDYLNKKQVEEVEEMVRTWNKESKTSNENIKNCIGMCLTDVNEQRFKDYNTTLKDCLAWLEKAGEQKPADYENPNIQQNDFAPKSAMEAIKEEKVDNANKVEQKFKEGDWVVYQNQTFQVTKDSENNLILQGRRYQTYFIEELCKPWTIDDAKSGDVLVNQNGEMPFIFKECKDNHIYCYCGYTNRKDIFFDSFVDSEGEELHWLNLYHEQVYPATKEQRTLLFQKMHETGYMWDTEGKQLVSLKAEPVEQKPSEWSREDEQWKPSEGQMNNK